MSKPINAKITDVLYIDHLNVYAQSESKLSCILKDTNSCMNDIGIQLNPKKCNVIHVERAEMKHEIPGIIVTDTVVEPPQIMAAASAADSGDKEEVCVLELRLYHHHHRHHHHHQQQHHHHHHHRHHHHHHHHHHGALSETVFIKAYT